MSNNFIQSLICQPVGLGGRTIWLDVQRPLDMRQLSKDLKLLLRSEGMSVTTTYSPNILVLQIHSRGIRGHYYVVKICQMQNKVLIETGIISAKQQLEWAGIEGGIAGISDEVLHNKFLTLLSGAFASIDVASVLGSYEEEGKILQQIEQLIMSYQQPTVQPYQTLPQSQQPYQYLQQSQPLPRWRFCPNCGSPIMDRYKFCPNCGYKLA